MGEKQITKERTATSLQIILSRKKPWTKCSQFIFLLKLPIFIAVTLHIFITVTLYIFIMATLCSA